MNIVEMETESTLVIEAKTIGHKRGRNVTYSVENSYHNICVDKRAIKGIGRRQRQYAWQPMSDVRSWIMCWLPAKYIRITIFIEIAYKNHVALYSKLIL